MYGGSGKLDCVDHGGLGEGSRGGRGRGSDGGGPGKRNIHSNFYPPPLHSPSGPPDGRLSLGGTAGPRNHTATSGPSSSVPSSSSSSTVEETFNLVSGNPLSFTIIIRLAPDLVEEIKRIEAQDDIARIKFDAHANNPSGNVIDVGGKDFRSTWSRETGDLCDLYEEQRSGEDGNGLLVESGCAWT